jgi:hypothetical protein
MVAHGGHDPPLQRCAGRLDWMLLHEDKWAARAESEEDTPIPNPYMNAQPCVARTRNTVGSLCDGMSLVCASSCVGLGRLTRHVAPRCTGRLLCQPYVHPLQMLSHALRLLSARARDQPQRALAFAMSRYDAHHTLLLVLLIPGEVYPSSPRPPNATSSSSTLKYEDRRRRTSMTLIPAQISDPTPRRIHTSAHRNVSAYRRLVCSWRLSAYVITQEAPAMLLNAASAEQAAPLSVQKVDYLGSGEMCMARLCSRMTRWADVSTGMIVHPLPSLCRNLHGPCSRGLCPRFCRLSCVLFRRTDLFGVLPGLGQHAWTPG